MLILSQKTLYMQQNNHFRPLSVLVLTTQKCFMPSSGPLSFPQSFLQQLKQPLMRQLIIAQVVGLFRRIKHEGTSCRSIQQPSRNILRSLLTSSGKFNSKSLALTNLSSHTLPVVHLPQKRTTEKLHFRLRLPCMSQTN